MNLTKMKSRDILTVFEQERVQSNLDLFFQTFPQTLSVPQTTVPTSQYVCYRLMREGLTPMNILIY